MQLNYIYVVPRKGVGFSASNIQFTNYLSQAFTFLCSQFKADSVFAAVPLLDVEDITVNRDGVVEIDGAARIDFLARRSEVTSLALVGFHAMSSFADQVVWDAFHTLPVGGSLTIVEPSAFTTILEGAYFAACATKEVLLDKGGSVVRWIKTAATASEIDSGLDRWSFCVPIERPSKAAIANLLAELATLGLTEYELIIASSVGFKYADERVRVIALTGADASLTAKKNAMASAAKYENLCIFHDRVALPSNFSDAVKRFGDHSGITAFQSIYIDSSSGRVERYSDLHVELGDSWRLIDAAELGKKDQRAVLYRHGLPIRLRWRTGTVEAHPGEATAGTYLTGTMYLAKRGIWNMVQQHPKIDWNELEDVEFGLYALTEYGIPSRINPHAITVTRRARAIMLGAKTISDRKTGRSALHLSGPPIKPPANKKDGYISELAVRNRAWDFARIHCPSAADLRSNIYCGALGDQKSWTRYWVALLYASIIPRSVEGLNLFLTDFSRSMFGYSYDRSTINALIHAILNGKFAVDAIVEDGYFAQSIRNADAACVTQFPEDEHFLDYVVDQIWRAPDLYRVPHDYSELHAIVVAALASVAPSTG